MNLQRPQTQLLILAGACALLLAGILAASSFQVQVLKNAAMLQSGKALFAPDVPNQDEWAAGLQTLYQVMDREADPYPTLQRIRELVAARWYQQSQWLKSQGKNWEDVFSYQEWTRIQFERTILDLWKASDSPNWYGLGRAAGRMGVWSLAAYFYQHALAANPDNSSLASLAYAQALLQLGKAQEAESTLLAARLDDPADQAQAGWLLTQAIAAQGRYAEAADLLQAVADDTPALVRTQEGARVAQAIEAHVPLALSPDLRAAWSNQISNLLINGGFEQGITGWGMRPVAGVNSTIDDERAYSGWQSLRVQFDGTEDVNFYQVAQTVPVQGGQQYQLSAHMWAEDLLGNLVLEVRAGDWFGGFTEPIMSGSTSGWQAVAHTFTAPADADEITVTVMRYGGNGPVSGTVWVDDIVLLPVAAQ